MRYKDFIKNKYYFFYHFTFFDLKAFCFWYSKNQKVVDWMLSFFVSLYFPFTYEMLLYFSFYSWHVALFFLLLMTCCFIFPFTHDMLLCFPFSYDKSLYFSFYSWHIALFFLLLMTCCFIFPFTHDKSLYFSFYSWHVALFSFYLWQVAKDFVLTLFRGGNIVWVLVYS